MRLNPEQGHEKTLHLAVNAGCAVMAFKGLSNDGGGRVWRSVILFYASFCSPYQYLCLISGP